MIVATDTHRRSKRKLLLPQREAPPPPLSPSNSTSPPSSSPPHPVQSAGSATPQTASEMKRLHPKKSPKVPVRPAPSPESAVDNQPDNTPVDFHSTNGPQVFPFAFSFSPFPLSLCICLSIYLYLSSFVLSTSSSFDRYARYSLPLPPVLTRVFLK